MPSSSMPTASETQLRRARTDLENGLRAGKDVRAEEMLAANPDLASDTESALELVYSEYVVREELGQNPTPEQWYERFPQWRADLRQMFEVHDELKLAEASLPHWSAARARSTSPPATHGERIGDFEVLGELGRGGMGVVYKARQTRLNRTVALKLILSGAHAGKKERDRFQREVESAAKLDHPNIVRIFEVGEHEGRPFCAMEFVGGGSLQDRIAGSPWPARPAAELMALLARAAHHAHERGVVHRDLKPANILVASDSIETSDSRRFACVPKIADFGLAKSLTDDGTGPTRTGDFLGTPAYMAPEQADGKSKLIGASTDIWALGVVLYEMLTGRPPFQGGSGMETMEQVRRDDPVQPRQLRAGVPRDLETICLKCLGKAQSDRYANAEALAEDLERFLREEPIRARPLGLPGRFQRWCRRSPRVAALSGAVAALLVAAAGLGTVAAAKMADARTQAKKVADSERNARMAEVERRTEDRRQIVRLQLVEATRKLEEGDPAGAAVFFAAALRNDPDPANEPVHRIRLGTALRASPRIVRSIWPSERRGAFFQVSRDGSTVVSSGIGPGLRALDTGTGRVHELDPKIAAATQLAICQLTHNGRVLIAMDRQGNASAWEVATSEPVKLPLKAEQGALEFPFSSNGGRWVQSSSDPKYLLVGSARGTVTRIDHGVGERPTAYAISPDGSLVAVGYYGGIAKLWKTSTAKEAGPPLDHHIGGNRPVSWLAFSPKGTRLVCACGTAQVWDVSTFKPVGYRLLHGEQGVASVGFSPGGDLVWTFGGDANVRAWRAETGEPASPMIPQSDAGRAQFSLDSKSLVTTTGDDLSRVWDSESGRPLTPLLSHAGGRAEFLGLSNKLVTVGLLGAVRVWEFPQSAQLANIVPVVRLAWLGDDRTVLVAGQRVRLWDAVEGKVRREIPHPAVVAADLAPNASRFLTLGLRDGGTDLNNPSDGEIRQWDALTGEPIGARFVPGSGRRPPVYAPDGRIVTTYQDGRIRFWNAETGEPDGDDWRQDGHVEFGVKFSPDGRRMLALGIPTVLWDVPARRQLQTFREVARWPSPDLSPDGTFVASVHSSNTLQFYDAKTGDLLPGEIPVGGWNDHLTISRDGQRIAAYSAEDRSIQVWDRKSRKPIGRPLPSPRNPGVIAFSPDGRLLARGSYDGLVAVWDIASGAPVAPMLPLPGWVNQVEFSRDGRRLAVSGVRGMVRVLDLAPDDRPIEVLEELARMRSDRRLDDRGELMPLSRSEGQELWDRLGSKPAAPRDDAPKPRDP